MHGHHYHLKELGSVHIIITFHFEGPIFFYILLSLPKIIKISEIQYNGREKLHYFYDLVWECQDWYWRYMNKLGREGIIFNRKISYVHVIRE